MEKSGIYGKQSINQSISQPVNQSSTYEIHSGSRGNRRLTSLWECQERPIGNLIERETKGERERERD